MAGSIPEINMIEKSIPDKSAMKISTIAKDSTPELEYALIDLSSLFVEVGKLVALYCDKFVNKTYSDVPSNFHTKSTFSQ